MPRRSPSSRPVAKKAGLEPFSHSRNVALPRPRRRRRPLPQRCARRSANHWPPTFCKHFRDKGFKLALPEHRLTVITLKDEISYQAYSGIDPGSTCRRPLRSRHQSAGHVRLSTQGQEPAVVANPERVNLLALVHETTHLLCFNTGLLSRKANVPDWVSEGLATYVEMWRNKQTPIGAPNRPWLSYLRDARNTALPGFPSRTWSPPTRRSTTTRPLELSYAESWLLVHYLMKEPQLPKFRAYLAGLPTDEAGRTALSMPRSISGSLKALEHDLER